MQIANQRKMKRTGAIVPLFALLLPVLLIVAAFAINLSHYHLTATELKIATDVASHAGARSLNVYQGMDNPTSDKVLVKMRQVIDRFYVMNPVAHETLSVPANFDDYIDLFNLGATNDRVLEDYADYQSSPLKISESNASGGAIFNSVGVRAETSVGSVFTFGAAQTFAPNRASVTKQIERDLAVVMDQSGSMLEFQDLLAMRDVLEEMYDQGYINYDEYRIAAGYQRTFNHPTFGLYFVARVYSVYNPRFKVDFQHLRRNISDGKWYYHNGFDIIPDMKKFRNDNPGDPRDLDAMVKYAESWEDTSNRKTTTDVTSDWIDSGMFENFAPRESKWDYLHQGMEAFVEILERTPAEEKISLVLFNGDAEGKSTLTSDYDMLLDIIAKTVPTGGTSIHSGMDVGLEKVLEPGFTRPFAEKIIVIMTDGSNSDPALRQEPVRTAERFVADNREVVLHTLTFGTGSDTTWTINPDASPGYGGGSKYIYDGVMVDVAEVGGGQHFHAHSVGDEDGVLDDSLEAKLREIANIRPVVFTY